MDALPPTLYERPAEFRETGLSKNFIGWHRCWQFTDHFAPGQAQKGASDTVNERENSKKNERFSDLSFDYGLFPKITYGSIMYIPDIVKDGNKNKYFDRDDVRKRAFIYSNNRNYFYFLDHYFSLNEIANSLEGPNLEEVLKIRMGKLKIYNHREISFINKIISPYDKIISLYKEKQRDMPYFRIYDYKPLFYPNHIEGYDISLYDPYLKMNRDSFDLDRFKRDYKGAILIELASEGYWMLGKKNLYIRTYGEWINDTTQKDLENIQKFFASSDDVSTASNDPIYNSIQTYSNIFVRYSFKVSKSESIWFQRWRPIPVNQCTMAFKPLVDDPAIPEHLKPIFPKISR